MRFKRVLRGVEGHKKKKPVQSTGQGENVLEGLIYNSLKRVP
jgi:hypothetical protein